MHKQKDKLEWTADGIRDRSASVTEQHIQASMQEETAKAMYAVAEQLEETNRLLEQLLDAEQGD